MSRKRGSGHLRKRRLQDCPDEWRRSTGRIWQDVVEVIFLAPGEECPLCAEGEIHDAQEEPGHDGH